MDINKNGYNGFTLDVVIYNEGTAQAKYLFRGIDDVYWCNDVELLLNTIKAELERIDRENE